MYKPVTDQEAKEMIDRHFVGRGENKKMGTETKRLTYEVYEDDGGGISLYVWSRETGEMVFSYSSYEYGGHLLTDLRELDKSDSISGWDGNEVQGYYGDGDISPVAEYKLIQDSECGYALIVCDGEIQVHQLGSSGMEALGLSGDRYDLPKYMQIRDLPRVIGG